MSVDSQAPDVYDPLVLFLDFWSQPLIAADLGWRINCYEVNALAALLHEYELGEAAELWKTAHSDICDEPQGH